MATVEVKDHVLWTKHIHGDAMLRGRLEALASEETVELRVNGQEGLWRKMKTNAFTKAVTPGLQPVGSAKVLWGALFKESRSAGSVLVDLELVDEDAVMRGEFGAAAFERDDVTVAERRAAWEAIKDLWRTGGWRSEAPYGSRDELYER